MLMREIIDFYSEDHTKHINALRGQNAEFFNVKLRGTFSYHRPLNGWIAPLVNMTSVRIKMNRCVANEIYVFPRHRMVHDSL
jgi:hypothetical protein